ncbi:PQQ-like domain-containing protein [Halopenitus malekzadehii]|uniref:PQQ-like domain-containing protein n=1 Tax=Halopenitus malekzadehii TaxID=1267564 RepID=A0A1H6II78_9EURY|nr:PQQ-binding-like beta-propeller repeat protein [Halopenitus malekzadehii]SEH46222.1 PQQ-like domain-containing protein [Halopenitus malekzadehii]
MPAGTAEYVRTSSFEVGELDAWAVSGDRVCILANGTEVYVVGEERDQITLPEPAESVALSDHLYAVTDDGVDAYSLSGTRLWRVSLPEAVRVAAPGESGFAVVVTEDDELVGLDATSGQERFRVDRPHSDVSATPAVVCTDDALVLAAWSFLSVLGPTGESRLQERVDGAISDLGVVGDTIVCVMKDARCVGIDIETGERKWSHDWQVDRIDPFGREEIILRTEGEIRAIDAEGEWTPLGLDDGLPVTAAGGEPVCVIVDTVANVYRRLSGEWTLDATLLSESLTAGAEAIHAELHNVGDTAASATIAIELSGARCSDPTHRVTLLEDDSERVRFPLSSIDEETVDLTITADEEVILEERLPVTGGSESIDVTVEPTRLTPEGLRVSVTLANETSVPVEDVRINPMGERVDRIDPNDAVTRTLEAPADGTLTIADATGIRRTVDVPRPEDPLSASGSVEEDVLAVRVRNDSRATVVDELTIDGDALPTSITRTFEGAPESVLELVAPPVEDGTSTVSVAGHFLDADVDLEIPESAVLNAATGTHAPPAAAPDGSAPGGTPGGHSAGGAGGAHGDAGPGTGDLELERRIDPLPPIVGDLCIEHIDVENVGHGPESVTVTTPDAAPVTETIRPGEFRTFTRLHAFTGVGDDVVPPVAVESGGVERTAGELDTELEIPELYCRGLLLPDRDGYTLEVTAVNTAESRLRVRDLELELYEFREPPAEIHVPPYEEVTATYRVDGPDPSTVGGYDTVRYVADGSVAPARDLEVLVEAPVDGPDGLATLTVAVDPETALDADGGTVAIAVENDGGATVTDLSIAARGDQVRTILYEADDVPELGPGETHVHYVDIETAEDGLDVALDVAGTVGGADHEETMSVVGSPESVSIDRETGRSGPDHSPRVSTDFAVE